VERETRRRGVETPSSQTVGGVSCLPGICVLRLPRLAIGRPASPVATNPWAFLGFRPRLASTPHGSGQRRAESSPPSHAASRRREKASSRAAAGQETSPTSLLAFISTRYCRLLPRSYLLPAPCSAFSSPVPPPPPRLASPALRFLRCGGVEEVSS